ncbi:response regulator transcription factor [Paenibacillus campi]|uniref:response regulator transcription factor n=1 Tax=Paenibacillus campi TaxID=3106031 RepID=UPI002AFE806E|nr:response regulator transcription factor [Paenibacillus sp. SGZ-1014]
MFKVMIVDDEPAIREGLKTIIDWDRIGFEVVDAAANGREALQKLERIQPDLMIMDIRMPGMNGLEVIEQLRRQHSRTHVLILSGHADFEYARRALGYGVDGYLLKPVDEVEMERELVRVYESLQQAQHLAVQRQQPVHEHELIEQMLLSSSGKEQERALQALALDWSSYQVLLLEQYVGKGDPADGWSSELEQLRSWWTSEQRHIIFRAGSYIGLLTGRPYGQRELGELRERLLAHCSAAEIWYVAAGTEVDELEQIRDSYTEAADLLAQRFWFGANGLALAGSKQQQVEVARQQSILATPQANEWADRLYYAVDIRSLEAAERVLSDLITACHAAGMAERDTKSLSSHVLSLALSRLPGSVSGSGPAVQQCLALIPELYSAPAATEMVRLMLCGLERLLQSINGVSHESVMKQMTDFIRRHYSDNLKLELLAEVFNYNSAYLGKMFKTYTGESFNHFLDGVRLDRAKQLLAQGMKVHKVASLVGYANVDYFHSKFKKYTGVSPSAYREQIERGEQG